MSTLSRCSWVLPGAALVALAGCSSPDRTFSEGAGGDATNASASGTLTTGASSTQGSGGTGTTGSGGSSSSSGPSCGDGSVEGTEACDESGTLCRDCALACPAGWFQAGDACFAVALGDVTQVDGLTGLARCGALEALDVDVVGHRAHPATPTTPEQFLALAQACPNNGCWLGYLALGEPAVSPFLAPSTDATLTDGAPWAAGEPTRGVRESCTRLAVVDDGDGPVPRLEDSDCLTELGYSACQLDLSWGAVDGCGDGVRTGDEECDEVGDPDCVACNRVCAEDQLEDPRSHACLFVSKPSGAFGSASDACSVSFAGAALATPDEEEDVRVAALLGAGWIGLDVGVNGPAWQSGESFTYAEGAYPMAGGFGLPGHGGLIGDDGRITFADAASLRSALCESHDPD